ncbi:MAG TPA: hypothetical protein VK982_09120 [Bacteroidales bacterium]|nr:hypothetical protein [Bacteroidales bacterium]
MAKINRYNGNVVAFGSEATGTERTVFGGTTQSDSLDQNLNSFYKRGFGIVDVNEAPTKQDFNAVNFTNSQLIAYLHQIGVPEWNASQEYHTDSFVNRNGELYKSLSDSNIGNDPETDSINWVVYSDDFVKTTGNEIIDGIKTFTESPIVPTPTTDFQAVSKKYVDEQVNKVSPDNRIIGLAEVQTGNRSGLFAHVDENGNRLFPDPAYFNNHPVYRNITYTIIDDQDMIRIPKFYYKVDTVPAGADMAGKKAWWISDQPATGFTLHPAFYDGATEIDYFYVGKYECVDDPDSTGVKAGSLLGKSPLVSIDFPAMKNRCAARNTAGVEGFHLWDIYELGAIQMLCFIEVGSPDVQSVIGSGNVNSASAVNTGGTDAVWRGIYEFWGNVWHMVDGLQVDTANLLQLVNPESGVLEDTTVTMSEADGWVTVFYDNFPAIFLPESVAPVTEDATYADHFWAPDLTEQNVCYHGGGWANGLSSGLFYLDLRNVASYSHTSIGGRLAKK